MARLVRVARSWAIGAWVLGASAGVLVVVAPASSRAAASPSVAALGGTAADLVPSTLDARSWLGVELMRSGRVLLPVANSLPLLGRYQRPSRARSAPWLRFWGGRYGPGQRAPTPALTWSTVSCDPGASAPPHPFVAPSPSLAVLPNFDPQDRWQELSPVPAWLHGGETPTPELLPLARGTSCAPWERQHPGTFFRHGLERDTFALLECDGSIAPEAIDRLSVMARPLGLPRPPLPLPNEPAAEVDAGEWLPGLRLVHPRLVWAMQQVANRFPYRAIYVVSGYRPGSAGSQHALGRAVDIQVLGVAKERLFAVCHELDDVACGYYPNHDFVHFDVRDNCGGHPVWIDVSLPNEPSRYVDAWPGVVESGGLRSVGEF
ncbi:MAG: DUF882 domain-containing protein [Polyangiaceae bacterium]|nr:DUF882 domain-containing protein [Polyangiaceae bacterium]